MKDNNYKTALVTGASSGIGYATAKKLSSIGIKVIASARRLQNLKKLQSETSCEIIQLDILDQKKFNEEQGENLSESNLTQQKKIKWDATKDACNVGSILINRIVDLENIPFS